MATSSRQGLASLRDLQKGFGDETWAASENAQPWEDLKKSAAGQ